MGPGVELGQASGFQVGKRTHFGCWRLVWMGGSTSGPFAVKDPRLQPRS